MLLHFSIAHGVYDLHVMNGARSAVCIGGYLFLSFPVSIASSRYGIMGLKAVTEFIVSSHGLGRMMMIHGMIPSLSKATAQYLGGTRCIHSMAFYIHLRYTVFNDCDDESI